VIDVSVPPRTIEVNRAAFEHGRNWARNVEDPGRAAPVEPPRSEAERAVEATQTLATGAGVRLEIIAAWCKGCDICVKVCPERCLSLDASRVVVIADPKACSGCRVCEWLCPDFAIRVRAGSISAQVAH
jgi:indolepyruvate ferredoxin oxidoreductase beta subunit